MSTPEGNDAPVPQFPADYHQASAARGPPTKPKGCRNVRGLPLHQRKLFRNLARQTPRVQGLTFDHNQIRWISYWKNEQNKQVQKHFPVSRYGFFGARKMALEERNRVQGWPLDMDEAAAAIERLKIDAAAFQGREDGSNPNPEDPHPLETDEENLSAQATESAFMRSMREDDEDGIDRNRAGSVTGRRASRSRPAKRSLSVSTQTERRASSLNSEKEKPDAPARQPEPKEEKPEPQPPREVSDYTEFLARAYALATARRQEHPPSEQPRKLRRQATESSIHQQKHGELIETFLALTPARHAGAVYLEGGPDRQSPGGSRLVSMASTSFEETDTQGDSTALRDNSHLEPDALRDLLNCVVTGPVSIGVDWEAECARATSVVDVSRPTRNPMNPQGRGF